MRPSAILLTLGSVLLLGLLTVTLLMTDGKNTPAWFEPITWLIAAVFLLVTLLDAFLSKRAPNLNIERHLPEHLSVGKAHSVVLSITPNKYFKKPMKVVLYDAYPADWHVNQTALHVDVLPKRGLKTRYEATPLMRGEALFGNIQYATFSPLGLWERHRYVQAHENVRVLPDFSKILGANLIGLSKWLELMGAKRLRRHGQGQDFQQLRDYSDGDDVRNIDWKATSKMQKPIVRTYQEERDQQLIFLLDCGRNMRTMGGDLSHFDHALNAMLLLGYTALKHDDAVGLMTFNHPTLRHIPPRKGVAHLHTLINSVYDLQPTQMAADYEHAVNHLLQHQKRRALVIVLTQLDQENNQHLLSQLQRLKKRCAVLVASLKQSERQSIDQSPITNLQQAHTYMGAQLYAQQEQQLLKQLTAQRVLHLNVTPQQLSTALINQYLELKRHGSW